MKKIGIFYGSDTGNTEGVAKQVAKLLGSDNVDVKDVSKAETSDFEQYDNLILGTATTGIGDLQDDWDSAVAKLKSAKLDGKTVALFGLGDSQTYPDTFVDSLGHLYEAVKDKGCKVIGAVATDEYEYDDSIAVVDGQFVGLAIDQDNEDDKTEERVDNWVNSIKGKFA
ncbi:MAG: flavodoxin [Bacteroidales bacterium]